MQILPRNKYRIIILRAIHQIATYRNHIGSNKTILRKSDLLSFSLICLLAYLFIGLLPPKAVADGISLSVTPATLHVRATPPADIRAPFSLTNQSTETIILTVQIRPLETNKNGQIILTTDLQATTSALITHAEVLEQEKGITSLTLGPKQTKELLFHLSLPQDTSLADEALAITFITVPKTNKEKENTISNLQAGIALPILIAPDQKPQRNVSIATFSTPLLYDRGPIPFTLQLTNHGDHYATPYGEIFIKNIFGQTIGKITIPKTTIFAKKTKTVPDIIWQENLPIGLNQANLTIASSDNGPYFHQTIYFIGFPFKKLLWPIIITVFSLFILLRIKSLFSKK